MPLMWRLHSYMLLIISCTTQCSLLYLYTYFLRLQESALRKYAKIDPVQKQLITFHLVPANPVDGLFGEKVHPSSLVSYRTRNEVQCLKSMKYFVFVALIPKVIISSNFVLVVLILF